VDLRPGLRINQYELIRELGRGGMGQVFLARDTRLGRRVAIKFLSSTSEELTQRLLREARATARCNHENIVVIYEVNEYGGLPFMVLEYLEGEPLRRVMQGSKLPPTRAVELMVPVVRALARAHEFDIVHRDLKPDNVLVLSSGVIKVVDFGIAKVFTHPAGAGSVSMADLLAVPDSGSITREGAIVGTMPYMSPEQWGADDVDHRTDLFAVGIMLFEMVAGRNPLMGMTPNQLLGNAVNLDRPLPGVGQEVPELPGDLERIIDRCTAKRKEERFASARELLDALEPLLPGRFLRQLSEDESPYPGLTAFQEHDAGKFFGRARDIVSLVARVREQPLVAVVGSTGVGKSSLVRAGVIPVLKSSGERWEVLVSRPGRSPISSLASLVEPLTRSSTADLAERLGAHQALMTRLREEPGYLGTLLRQRARQKDAHVLLFIDQFEELYTLVPDAEERRTFMACLAGTADDAASPLRVVVSIRSDFLERVAENPRFMDEMTRGLYFLKLPEHQGLREAITQPSEMVGYSFEAPEVVEEMLSALHDTTGALPLLQFAASKLWESRDQTRKLLTRGSYEAMGGIAGALASHANEVLAGLAPAEQKLVRSIFGRLVTPEGTRAIVDVEELRELSSDPAEAERVVDYLVTNRLLVVQTRGEDEGPAVEIVHESLIGSWPTLRRWIDESQEDAVQLEQLRSAAKQWEAKGRPQGLLWRGEAMEETRLWHRRYTGMLATREKAYLDAVFKLANRATQIRRGVVGGIIGILLVLVAVGAIALFTIRNAKKRAEAQAVRARREAERARAAETRIKQQIAVIRATQAAERRARAQAASGKAKLAVARSKLIMSYQQLEAALKKARQEKLKAEKATQQVSELLAKERARVQRLLREKKKIGTKLH
jgi:serine/threonine protein kinase